MRTMDAVRRSGVGIGPERTVREAAAVMEQADLARPVTAEILFAHRDTAVPATA